MAGLAEFLLARIADDETAAQEARGWKAPTGKVKDGGGLLLGAA
jgi:hypothetical protein